MEQHHKVAVPLVHRVEVTAVLHYLSHHLHCDGWYVAAHREHLFVFHLTAGEQKRFAVCVECTAPVEKGIYHGSTASSVSVLSLGDEPELSPDELKQIRAGLGSLTLHAHDSSPVS